MGQFSFSFIDAKTNFLDGLAHNSSWLTLLLVLGKNHVNQVSC